MSLDDAVNEAKARREQQARMHEAFEEGQRREKAQIAELLKEAVDRLSSSARVDEYVRVAPTWWFGSYASDGKRYSVATRKRCWVLTSGWSCRTEGAPLVPSSVLLLESGAMGRFYKDESFDPQHEGEFVTSLRLAVPNSHDYVWGESRSGKIEGLKHTLANAILTYGAA